MAAKFWIGGTGTWDNSTDTHWSTSSNGANNTTHPIAGDTVTFDASSGGGTVTVNADLAFTSLTMGAFTGTIDFSANNNNVTCSSLSTTGSGTRTLNLGNGTWTLTLSNGIVWDGTTVTNFTFNANSGKVLIAPTSQTGTLLVTLTGKTFNILEINQTTGALNDPVIIAAAPTITTLTVTSARQLAFDPNTTTTITNSFSWAGTSSAQKLLYGLAANGKNGAATLSLGGACTLDWAAVGQITKSGAGSLTVTNGFDLGNNTNVTITGPTNVLSVIGG